MMAALPVTPEKSNVADASSPERFEVAPQALVCVEVTEVSSWLGGRTWVSGLWTVPM